MLVTLDQEQWEASAGASIGEVLSDLSDRAHERAHIITSLLLDQRRITDRDLDPTFLSVATTGFSRLTASSEPMQLIVQKAQASARLYAGELGKECASLARAFRAGLAQVATLDQWLGKLADYLELMEGPRKTVDLSEPSKLLAPWVQQLVDARSRRDLVLMADLLEYEILPRLEA
jgi:hypothetical protein